MENSFSTYKISNKYLVGDKLEQELKFRGYFPNIRLLNNLQKIKLSASNTGILSKIEVKFVRELLQSNGEVEMLHFNPSFSWQKTSENYLNVTELTPLFLRNRNLVRESVAPLLAEDISAELQSGSMILPYLFYAEINEILPKSSRKHLLKNVFSRSVEFQFPYFEGSSAFPNSLSDFSSLLRDAFPKEDDEKSFLSEELKPDGFEKRENFVSYARNLLDTTSNLSFYRSALNCPYRNNDKSEDKLNSLDGCVQSFVRIVELLKIASPQDRLILAKAFHLESFIEKIVYISELYGEIDFNQEMTVQGIGSYSVVYDKPYLQLLKPEETYTVTTTFSKSYVDFLNIMSNLHTGMQSDLYEESVYIDAHLISGFSTLFYILTDKGAFDLKYSKIIEVMKTDKTWIKNVESLLLSIEKRREHFYQSDNIRVLLSLFK